jgi:hypothetical protein
MKGLAILLCLSVGCIGVAHADDAPAAVDAPKPSPPPPLHIDTSSEPQFDLKMQLPNPQRRRRIAIGLLVTSAVFLTLGAAFVGAAKSANDKVFSNMTYHPSQEDHRLAFEVTDVAFFTASVVTFAPGMVLMWDR